MIGGMIGTIELNEVEKTLADKIVSDLNAPLGYEQTIENGERTAALMHSLLDRKAIPDNRLPPLFTQLADNKPVTVFNISRFVDNKELTNANFHANLRIATHLY